MESAAALETRNGNHDVSEIAAEGYPEETRITQAMLMHTRALRVLFSNEVPHTMSI